MGSQGSEGGVFTVLPSLLQREQLHFHVFLFCLKKGLTVRQQMESCDADSSPCEALPGVPIPASVVPTQNEERLSHWPQAGLSFPCAPVPLQQQHLVTGKEISRLLMLQRQWKNQLWVSAKLLKDGLEKAKVARHYMQVTFNCVVAPYSAP